MSFCLLFVLNVRWHPHKTGQRHPEALAVPPQKGGIEVGTIPPPFCGNSEIKTNSFVHFFFSIQLFAKWVLHHFSKQKQDWFLSKVNGQRLVPGCPTFFFTGDQVSHKNLRWHKWDLHLTWHSYTISFVAQVFYAHASFLANREVLPQGIVTPCSYPEGGIHEVISCISIVYRHEFFVLLSACIECYMHMNTFAVHSGSWTQDFCFPRDILQRMCSWSFRTQPPTHVLRYPFLSEKKREKNWEKLPYVQGSVQKYT